MGPSDPFPAQGAEGPTFRPENPPERASEGVSAAARTAIGVGAGTSLLVSRLRHREPRMRRIRRLFAVRLLPSFGPLRRSGSVNGRMPGRYVVRMSVSFECRMRSGMSRAPGGVVVRLRLL